MKTEKELNALKEEVESVSKKLSELTADELKLVTGGGIQYDWRDYGEGDQQPFDVVCPDCGNVIAVINNKRTINIFCPVCRAWKTIEVK